MLHSFTMFFIGFAAFPILIAALIAFLELWDFRHDDKDEGLF